MSSNLPPDANVGRLPVDLRPRRLSLLPYNDLLIDQGRDDRFPIDPKGFQLTLGMIYGLGPNEMRVLRTDDGGNLLVSTAGQAAAGSVRIQDGTAATLASVGGFLDFQGGLNFLSVMGIVGGFDGSNTRIFRQPSSSVLGSLSSSGGLMVAPPGQWAVQHSPATGAVATISKTAGAAGVRNVCTGFSFGFSSGVAIAANSVIINLRDGASGAGAILHSWIYDLPAAIIAPFSLVETGFEIPGTAAVAMTLEFTALVANLREFVNLSGHLAS